jgi:hypothetical protein
MVARFGEQATTKTQIKLKTKQKTQGEAILPSFFFV